MGDHKMLNINGNLFGIRKRVYSPTDFANLEYWYDASKITGLTDGAEVLSLSDLSGNNKTLTPTSSFRRPTYRINQINGLPALEFGSPGDGLKGLKTDFDFLHQGDSTVFFIFKATVLTGTSRVIFSSNTGQVGNVGRHFTATINGSIRDYMTAGVAVSGQDVFDLATASGVTQIGEWHLVVSRYQVGKSNKDAEMFFDDIRPIVDEGPQLPSQTTSTAEPCFGSNSNGTNGFTGYLAEWFAYSRALSNEEINKLVGGLNFGS